MEDGSLSGTCHKLPDEEKTETAVEAYALAAFTNPLNPDAFPGIRDSIFSALMKDISYNKSLLQNLGRDSSGP